MVCVLAFGMALFSLATSGKVDDYGLLFVVATLSLCSVIGFAALGALLKRWPSQKRA